MFIRDIKVRHLESGTKITPSLEAKISSRGERLYLACVGLQRKSDGLYGFHVQAFHGKNRFGQLSHIDRPGELPFKYV